MTKHVSSDLGALVALPEWILLLPGLSDRAYRLLAVLRSLEGEGGIYPSRGTLARMLGRSRDKIDRALEELVEHNLLTVIERWKTGEEITEAAERPDKTSMRTSNRYELHLIRQGTLEIAGAPPEPVGVGAETPPPSRENTPTPSRADAPTVAADLRHGSDPDPEDPGSDPQINYPDKNHALYGLKPEPLSAEQLAVFRHLHRSTSRLRGGGAPDASWCEDLIRRGATLEDVEHAIDAASTKTAGLRYARATLQRCVEQREANEDPHARPVVTFRGRRPAEPRAGRPDTPTTFAARAALVAQEFPEGMTLAQFREQHQERVVRAAREAAEAPS